VISCFKCNDPIIFSDSWISEKSGRKIPLDESTHEPHKCAAADFISQAIECQYCNEEIIFSNEHISQRGKKIPLNPETMQPHSCEAWRETRKDKIYCKYCLETEITFDTEHMTEKGKFIPVEVNSGEIHKCSKRVYNPNTKVTTTIF
jgi:hypothetical protein